MTLPIVALHGWALNLRVFDALFADLDSAMDRGAINRRALSRFDLPGHGRAPEPLALQRDAWPIELVAETLLAQMPARCILIGWSLGATLALHIAAQAPERVAALVLVSATPRFARAADWPHGSDPNVLEGFVAQLAKDYRRTVAEFLELQVRGSVAAEATLAALRAALAAQGECTAAVLQRAVALLHATDLRASLPRIAAPALVITGRYDRIVHPDASRALAALLPNARGVELERCGHAPFLSHRDEFNAALLSFLANLDATEVAA
ncbi:MAG: alpha/beta fold hydrolase [Steroidobacteraceae bacterium]